MSRKVKLTRIERESLNLLIRKQKVADADVPHLGLALNVLKCHGAVERNDGYWQITDIGTDAVNTGYLS